MGLTDLPFPIAIVVVCVIVALLASPVMAASGSVELDAALEDQTAETTMTFSFTPSQNMTVTADNSLTTANGNVEFVFDEWDDEESGEGGSRNSWDVVSGHSYSVTYAAEATSEATEGTHSVTADVVDNSGNPITSETLTLTVEKLYPEFGSIEDVSAEVIFVDDDDASRSVDVEFPNQGEGVMVPTMVSFQNVPDGFSINTDSLSNQVEPGASGTATLDIVVDRSVDVGTYTFTGTITDNLNNEQSFSVTIEVHKPPVISAADINIDGVVHGSPQTVQLTIEEAGGFTGIDGVDVVIDGSEPDGAIDISGANLVNTEPGGSDTIEVTISANDAAPQHASLDWTLQLTPENEHSPSTTVNIQSEVWYPPRLGDVEVDSEQLPFDEPRDETDLHTTDTELTIENDGDLDMIVTDIIARSSHDSISASVISPPDSVPGLSTESATIRVSADADTPEGTYPFSVIVRTDGAGTETVDGEITVEHEKELVVSQNNVAFRDVPLGERRTRTIQLAERFGYQSVDNLRIERESNSGNVIWISIEDRPTSISAGESVPLVFSLQFDASAEPFTQYTWVFEVSGDGVDSQQITVSGRPIIPELEDVNEALGEYESREDLGSIATPIRESLMTIDRRFQNDEISGQDLSMMSATGDATVYLLDTLTNTPLSCETDDAQVAQSNVIRAAATLNIIQEYNERIEDPELRSAIQDSIDEADIVIREMVNCRQDYYVGRLNGTDNDTTTLERAAWNRELEELAVVRGNEEAANEYNMQATQAFETYISQTEEGIAARQDARVALNSLEENSTLVLAGQPLYLNPAKVDSLERRVNTIDSLYASASMTFERAGATQEAEGVEAERSRVTNRLQITEYVLWGSTGLYGLVVALGLFRTGRNLYTFMQDRRIKSLGNAVS